MSNKNYFFESCLIIIAVLFFSFEGITAFDTSLDIYPFFERELDPNYLINDFYTNSISNEFNPKIIWGKFITIPAKLLSVNWYNILFFYKTFFIILFPVLIFKTFLKLGDLINFKINKYILFFLVILLISPISKIYSIAWWPPYDTSLIPDILSLFCVLLSFILFFKKKFFAALALILACFIHPVSFVYSIIFLVSILILNFNTNKKTIVHFLISLIVILFLYYVIIPSETSLSDKEFIELYTLQNHSSHYRIEYFGSYLSKYLNWKICYATIVLSFILITLIDKRKKVIYACILSIVLFNMSIIAQYVFVNVLELRIGAILSPIRFSRFIFWYFIFLVSGISLWERFPIFNHSNFKLKVKNMYFITPVLIVILFVFKDNPKQELFLKNKEFYDFVNNTDSDSVYAIYPSELNFNFPFISNRAVFHGIGFPFNESYIKEYTKRKNLIYGSFEELKKYKGHWIGEKQLKFYNNLSLDDIIKIKKDRKLDYIIFQNNTSNNFNALKEVFKNENFIIYSLNDLL